MASLVRMPLNLRETPDDPLRFLFRSPEMRSRVSGQRRNCNRDLFSQKLSKEKNKMVSISQDIMAPLSRWRPANKK